MSRPPFAALFAALFLVACQQTPVPVAPTKPAVDPGGPAQETPKESPVAAPARRFEIDVVDVGTGLAVLVQGPDFAMVYDGGSNDDLALGGSNRFLAYLRAVAPQRRTIDHLVLSHPHRDHVELLPDLFANYAVGDVWDSGAVNDICGYRRFLSAIASAPRTRYHAAHGSAFQQPDARRRLQFPPAPAKPGARPFATASEIAGSGVARDGGPTSTGARPFATASGVARDGGPTSPGGRHRRELARFEGEAHGDLPVAGDEAAGDGVEFARREGEGCVPMDWRRAPRRIEEAPHEPLIDDRGAEEARRRVGARKRLKALAGRRQLAGLCPLVEQAEDELVPLDPFKQEPRVGGGGEPQVQPVLKPRKFQGDVVDPQVERPRPLHEGEPIANDPRSVAGEALRELRCDVGALRRRMGDLNCPTLAVVNHKEVPVDDGREAALDAAERMEGIA